MSVEDKLKGIFARVVGIDEEEISPTASLKDDLGIDSTEMVDLLVEIEKEFGLKASKDILNDMTTIDDITNYIDQRLVKK
jgi:acyl carrier protein